MRLLAAMWTARLEDTDIFEIEAEAEAEYIRDSKFLPS